MLKGLIAVIFLYGLLFLFAEGLKQFSLYETKGRCEVMFNCVCTSIGDNICDGERGIMGSVGE